MKNIIIICIFILLIYYFSCINNEGFTQSEMNNYSNMLKVNCDENTKSYKYLKKLNKEKCYQIGKTDRETINNKTVCYDNIGKEIISKLDMESNCAMANIVNNTNTKQNLIINDQVSNLTKNQLPTAIEGPDFINSWDLPTYDTKKSGDYSNITLSNPYLSSNNLASISNSNVI